MQTIGWITYHESLESNFRVFLTSACTKCKRIQRMPTAPYAPELLILSSANANHQSKCRAECHQCATTNQKTDFTRTQSSSFMSSYFVSRITFYGTGFLSWWTSYTLLIWQILNRILPGSVWVIFSTVKSIATKPACK